AGDDPFANLGEAGPLHLSPRGDPVDLVERASPCTDYGGVAPYLPVELRAGPDAEALAHVSGNRRLVLSSDSGSSAGHGHLLSITLGNILGARDSSKARMRRDGCRGFGDTIRNSCQLGPGRSWPGEEHQHGRGRRRALCCSFAGKTRQVLPSSFHTWTSISALGASAQEHLPFVALRGALD